MRGGGAPAPGLLAVLLLAAGVATAQSGGGYDLTQTVIAGGGQTASGGSYSLDATAGQADAGAMRGGSYTVSGGFWVAPSGGVTPPVCVGDCVGTDKVAVNDVIILVKIALGSAGPSACPRGIPAGGTVNVAVIIQAVKDALGGCPAG